VRPDPLLLGTETTGLAGEIVEIGVIRGDGSVALHSLVRPVGEMGATEIHGITAEMVAGAPSFAAIEPQLRALLHGHKVAVYNVDFDQRMLWGEVYRMLRAQEPRDLDTPIDHSAPGAEATYQERVRVRERLSAEASQWIRAITWRCVMLGYAEYVGEWNEHHQSYRWQRLPSAGHRALDDCQATLRVLCEMAASPLSTEGGTAYTPSMTDKCIKL